MPKLGEYLKAINTTKESLFDDDFDSQVDSEYPQFVVNRCVSYHIDAIMFSNMINMWQDIPNRWHFDFLRHTLRPKNRWSKWQKKSVVDDIGLIKKFYGYNDEKAITALKLLSEEDIEEIRESLDEGGLR